MRVGLIMPGPSLVGKKILSHGLLPQFQNYLMKPFQPRSKINSGMPCKPNAQPNKWPWMLNAPGPKLNVQLNWFARTAVSAHRSATLARATVPAARAAAASCVVAVTMLEIAQIADILPRVRANMPSCLRIPITSTSSPASLARRARAGRGAPSQPHGPNMISPGSPRARARVITAQLSTPTSRTCTASMAWKCTKDPTIPWSSHQLALER